MDRLKHKPAGPGGKSGALRFDADDTRLKRLLEIATPPTDGAGLASREILMPVFTRPNDPLMAADVREIVAQTVDECIEAGTAEVVSEFALPIVARALALSLNLPADHAEEWVSWGPRVVEPDGGRSAAVDAYIDRQLDRALKRPGRDFFSLLAESARTGRTGTRKDLRHLAAMALATGRDRSIDVLVDGLRRIAGNTGLLAELRDRPGAPARMAREQVGLRIRGDAPWEAHTELVVRCVLLVLSDRVERLTVLSSDEGRESRRLLINFKPLEQDA